MVGVSQQRVVGVQRCLSGRLVTFNTSMSLSDNFQLLSTPVQPLTPYC